MPEKWQVTFTVGKHKVIHGGENNYPKYTNGWALI